MSVFQCIHSIHSEPTVNTNIFMHHNEGYKQNKISCTFYQSNLVYFYTNVHSFRLVLVANSTIFQATLR